MKQTYILQIRFRTEMSVLANLKLLAHTTTHTTTHTMHSHPALTPCTHNHSRHTIVMDSRQSPSVFRTQSLVKSANVKIQDKATIRLSNALLQSMVHLNCNVSQKSELEIRSLFLPGYADLPLIQPILHTFLQHKQNLAMNSSLFGSKHSSRALYIFV